MSVSTISTVRELAVTVPGATSVFERLGIDYCCGGGRTLREACEKSHVAVDEVIRHLEEAKQATQPGAEVRAWEAESMTDLAAHIVDTHHFFTKQELERIEQILDKVCTRHGANHPELLRLRTLFETLKQDLLPHMLKEEQVLFPFIARMEEAIGEGLAVPPPFFVTVQNPVRMMTQEHDTAGDLLREMRAAANNYVAPPDACISFQTLYQALAEFEADLHQHIHLENNILFPRAVMMENEAQPEWQARAGEHQCFGH
jgi:regulator of cell morphogenesis and NO signaling